MFFFNKKIAIYFLILFPFFAYANKADVEFLFKTLNKYKEAKYVSAEFTKKVTSGLMGSAKDFSGTIDFAEGKMNLKITEPQKELLVYDGKVIWVTQKMPKEQGGKYLITKTRVNPKADSQILLTKILKSKFIKKTFSISTKEDSRNFKVFNLEPKKKDPQLTKIEIVIDKNEKIISEFRFLDEVDNETIYKFNKYTFHEKLPEVNLFNFKVPKGAEVTEL